MGIWWERGRDPKLSSPQGQHPATFHRTQCLSTGAGKDVLSLSLSPYQWASRWVIALGQAGQHLMTAGLGVPGSSGPSQPIAPRLHQLLLVLITSLSPDRLPPCWALDFSILRGLLGPNRQIKLCPWRRRFAAIWQYAPPICPPPILTS